MASTIFSNAVLKAASKYKRSWPMNAKLQFTKGKAVSVVTATAVNQKQSISIGSGTPSSGSFELVAEGTTISVAYNATAAAVQTALEAIFGAGNVSCTGGALPGTPVVVEFIGDLASLTQTVMTIGSSSLSAGTAACAISQVAVPKDHLVAWNPARITDPSAALSVSATGSGGSLTATVHEVAYTWYTAQGETIASPPTVVTLTSGQVIRVAAISAGSVPSGALGIYVYVDGQRCSQIALSTGAVPQTDITGFTAGLGFLPVPRVNAAYTATDGSHQLLGFLDKDSSSNYRGETFHATAAQSNVCLTGQFDCDVVVGGIVGQADLNGISGNETILQTQLGARILRGSIAGGDAEFAFGPFGGMN